MLATSTRLVTRRSFLRTGVALAAGLAVPRIACANLSDYWHRDRTLWLRRGQDEEYRVTYWSGGQLDPSNYHRLCYLLRDARESTTVAIDPALLDLLYGVQYWQELLLNRPLPLVVSSGFRTRKNNSRIEGAARNSMHLYGKAADLQSPYFSPLQVAEMGAYFGVGGVGVYSRHTHLDTGRRRVWRKD
jgi:uncharacterized protein YcbK (DUF882 family)